MSIAISILVILFVTLLQSVIPYLLKKSIVFGVTIPEGFSNEPILNSFKRRYSISTLCIGIVSLLLLLWISMSSVTEETVILVGVAGQFTVLLGGAVLYLFFHNKTSKLKIKNKWGAHLKQVRIADIAIRTSEEMLPWTIYLLPIAITTGIIAYTATQYANLPDLIPTHWGIDGQPDAFSVKTPLSSIALLLILLIMQGMMIGINEMVKRSGIKLNATQKKKSRAQQLAFRKYTSWFLFLTTLLLTALFSYLQLMTIHENIGSPALLLAIPLGFLVLTLLMTAFYAVKIGQSGSRLDFEVVDEPVEGITDYDDDQYWKAGVFYFNKNDPSIFVEKRFGVGWTLNFSRPLGYLILFVPILLIIIITFLI